MIRRLRMSDDPPVENVGQPQHGFDFVFHHPPDRDAGPVGDHGGHGLRVHAGQNQRRFALKRMEFGLQRFQLDKPTLPPRIGFGRDLLIHRAALAAQVGAQR